MGILVFGIIFAVLVAIPYASYLLLARIVSPSGSPANKAFVSEPVSIVLPTYNEAAIVEETLSKLLEQSYPIEQLEIIVTDSSNDRTPEIVRRFAAEHEEVSITLIHESERSGVATAINKAITAASHDIIFRTDCDSRLGNETICHAVANLQDDRFGGVTGQQTTVLGGSQVETEYRNLQARNQALESKIDSTFIVHGPCFAFRRGLFQTIPSDTVADDTEIAVRIRKQGKRIAFDPQMEFAEAGVSDFRGRRTRKDRRAIGLLQLLIRHRDMIGKYRFYGSFILPFNWWFLVVAPWLTVGALLFTIGGIGLLFPPLGLLCLGLFVGFVWAGQRDWLGPFQSLYAVLDSNLSLVLASIRLYHDDGNEEWEIDTASREIFSRDT